MKNLGMRNLGMKYLAIVLCCALALALAPPRARAQSRTVDFTQPVPGLDGKYIPGPDGKPTTLSYVVVQALTAQFKGEEDEPLPRKLTLYALAHKVYENKSAALTAEDVTTIKERVGKMYGPVVVGAVFQILDPNSLPTSK